MNQVNLGVKRIRYCEALCYSFELLSYNYNDLYAKCISVTRDKKSLIPALSQAWAIVDLIHRIREILHSMPGLNQKDKQLKNILKDTRVVESFRHYIQHLRKELQNEHLYPIYGSLSWVDEANESRCHIITSGFELNGTRHSGCVYDTQDQVWVSKVSLSIMDLSLNFDLVYESLLNFREYFYEWIIKNYGIDLKKFMFDEAKIFQIDIELRTKKVLSALQPRG